MTHQEKQTIGPYTLVKQVAVGGMAEIYLARTSGVHGFEKYLALKVIHPNYANDERFIEMLIDEAKISVGLNHTNIVQVFDLGRHDGAYYITMEYIDGADLFQIMRQVSRRGYPVPFDIAAYIAREVCAGLDYAHNRKDTDGNPLNIIHRDVSPQNVLISRAGEVKLVDFGIAKAASRSQRTRAGVIKGKYYYMSPEQALGQQLDLRTDIFSIGVVTYEVLAGRMIYLEEDVNKLLSLVRAAEIPPLSSRRVDVPPALDHIISKAIAREPIDRWESGQQMAAALTNFLYEQAPGFTPHRVAQLLDYAIPNPTLLNRLSGHATADKRATRSDDSAHAHADSEGHRFNHAPPSQLLSRAEKPSDRNSVIFTAAGELQPISSRTELLTHGAAPHAAHAGATRDLTASDLAASDSPAELDQGEPTRISGPPSMLEHTAQREHEPAKGETGDTPDTSMSELPATQMSAAAQSISPVRPESTIPQPDSQGGHPPSPHVASRPSVPAASAGESTIPQPDSQGGHPPSLGGPSPHVASRPSVPAASAGESTIPQCLPSLPPLGAAENVPGEPTIVDGSTRSAADAINQAVATAAQLTRQRNRVQSERPAAHLDPVVVEPELQGGRRPSSHRGPSPHSTSHPSVRTADMRRSKIAEPRSSTSNQPLWAAPTVASDVHQMATPSVASGQRRSITKALLTIAMACAMSLGLYGLFMLSQPSPLPILEIVSKPAGATVQLNGKRLADVTPVRIEIAEPRKPYMVRITLPHYRTWSDVTKFAPDERHKKIIAVLSEKIGRLRVTTIPNDVQVFIDDDFRGKTPLVIENLPVDRDLLVKLRRDGYEPAKHTVRWGSQRDYEISVTLTAVDERTRKR